MLARKKPKTATHYSHQPQLCVVTPTTAAGVELQQPGSHNTTTSMDTPHEFGDIERVAVLSIN